MDDLVELARVLPNSRIGVIRNGSIPRPSTPCILAVRFNLPPIPQDVGTPGVILDACDSLLKLPCAAVRGKDFEIE